MKRNEYDEQAEKFCKDFGFEVKAAFKGDRCPPWDDDKHCHGDRYRVTIKRSQVKVIKFSDTETCPNGHKNCLSPGCYLNKKGCPTSISFDFWNSLNDSQKGERPSAYDILACISSDVSMPTDPDELISEIGPMKVKQALASCEFTKRLQAFFTEAEISALSEIR